MNTAGHDGSGLWARCCPVSNEQELPRKPIPQHIFASTQQCNHMGQVYTAHQYISNLPIKQDSSFNTEQRANKIHLEYSPSFVFIS